jgi:hypothetical protein
MDKYGHTRGDYIAMVVVALFVLLILGIATFFIVGCDCWWLGPDDCP